METLLEGNAWPEVRWEDWSPTGHPTHVDADRSQDSTRAQPSAGPLVGPQDTGSAIV